jgi:hypothetical protein
MDPEAAFRDEGELDETTILGSEGSADLEGKFDGSSSGGKNIPPQLRRNVRMRIRSKSQIFDVLRMLEMERNPSPEKVGAIATLHWLLGHEKELRLG